jgi:hypothetical protein
MRINGCGVRRLASRLPHTRAYAGLLRESVVGQNVLRASLVQCGLSLVTRNRWTGVVVSQVVYTRAHLIEWGWENLEGVVEKFFNRPGGDKSDKDGEGVPMADPAFRKAYPTLAAYLLDVSWPDGEERQVGSLVVFAEEGQWKVCLSDRDTGHVLWASAKTFGDLCLCLEARLTDKGVDWRKAKNKGKRS